MRITKSLWAVFFALTAIQGYADSCKKGEVDYIIVGLGTAGSVLARDLSDPVHGKYKNSVLVLEAGQNRSDDPVVSQGNNFFFNNIDQLAYSSKYAITKICPDPNPLLGFFPNEQYSAGRMWFGSSAHNFLGAVRGSTDRWDDLAVAAGDTQWTYNNLLEIMKSLETYNGTTTQPVDRGFTGPLQVTLTEPIPSGVFANAVSTVTGAPITVDFNVPDGNTAVSNGQNYNTADGNVRSYGYDFLPVSILHPNGKGANGRKLRVLSGSFVNRVLFKGKKAIGVEYVSEDKTVHYAYAKKKVILCAGSPFSAAILQRSGVGPRDVLEDPKVNVPVLIENDFVGTGLKEHYGILFGMTEPQGGLNGVNIAFSDGRNFFAPAGGGDDIRRFQTFYLPSAAVLPAGIISAIGFDPSTPSIAGTTWNMHPRSSGTAFIVDASPFTTPDIRFNLYSDGDLTDPASDLSASVAALKMVKAIADEAGVTMIYPDAAFFASDDALAFIAGGQLNFSQLSMTNHYSGTCNMGTSRANSVVSGHDLHVFGTKHLMVADSSVFPFPMSGNTAWQCYVVGRKAASIIKSGG